MRVVHVLGVLCVVAATAYGQGNGGSGSDNENDSAVETTTADSTIRGRVVYTPHERNNLFIVTRSAGADPGPQDDSRNDDRRYGRVVHRPEDRFEPGSGASFDELRRIIHRREPGNDDRDYGRVIYSPSERTQPESGGKFDELRRMQLHHGESDKRDENINRDETMSGPLDTVRNILRNPSKDFNNMVEGMAKMSEGGMKTIENMESTQRELREKIGSGRRNEHGDKEPSDEEYDPEEMKNIAENIATLFNNFMKTGTFPTDSPLFQTNPDYTGMMDSALAVANDINKVAAAADRFKELQKRSADEPLQPELILRDVRKRRSFDGLQLLSEDNGFIVPDRRSKRTVDKFWQMFQEKFRDLFNNNNDNFRDIVDIRRKRMVDDPNHRDDQVEKERVGSRKRRMVDDPNHRDDQVEKERYGSTSKLMVDDPNHRDDQVEKERFGSRKKRMVDDPVHRDDQVEAKEGVGRKRRSDDSETTTQPPRTLEAMDKMEMAKRSIIEEDVPLPPFDDTETSDITRSGGLGRRQERSIIDENTPLPPFDDTETSDITKSGDLGMRQERSTGDDKDSVASNNGGEENSAEERESFFVPVQLHEIDITNSRYVPVDPREIDVDYVHGNEGRIQEDVDRKDEETETSDENSKVLSRSRRNSDIPPDFDEFAGMFSNRTQEDVDRKDEETQTSDENSKVLSRSRRNSDVAPAFNEYIEISSPIIQENVDHQDEETETSDENSEGLSRSRRHSDIPPDFDEFFRMSSPDSKNVPPVELLPLSFDEAVHTIIADKSKVDVGPSYRVDNKIAEEKIRSDVGPEYTIRDDPSMIVADKVLHKPIHSVVEAIEDRGNLYDKPIIKEHIYIKERPTVEEYNPTDNTESKNNHEQQNPTIIVQQQGVHNPIHSVVETIEVRGDLYDKPIIKEHIYIKERPTVPEYNPPDNTESKNNHEQENPTVVVQQQGVHKPIHSVVEGYIPSHEENGSSHAIVTGGIGQAAVNTLTDSSAINVEDVVNTPNQPLPDTVVESTHFRVNDREMRLYGPEKEVTASSTSAPETTVPVTDTTHPVTDTTHPVTDTTHPVTDTTHPVTDTTHPVTDTTHPVTDTTVPASETTVSVTTNEPVSVPHDLPVHLPMTDVKPIDTVLTPENLLDERLEGLPTIKSTPVPVESTPTTSAPSEETVVVETSTTPLPTTETTTQVSENGKSGLERRLKNLIPIVTVLTEEAFRTRKENKENKDNIDPRDSRGPHLFPGVVPPNPTSAPKIDSDRIVPPAGFEEVPDFKTRESTGIFGPTFSDHPVVSISDVPADKLEDDYEDTSISGGKKIVPHNKNRGGYDKNHGGYDDKHIDCDDDYDSGYGKDHGGYDKNRGGYGKNRGGYDKNHGGYDKNRGGYDKHHGGYDDHHDRDYDDDHHGGYDDHHDHDYDDGSHGGYGDHHDHDRGHGHHGGYDDHHGHDYDDDSHGGYDDHRDCDDDFGGYNKNRGGYNKNRGGYDKNCGGYNKNCGGYNKNRGGYDNNRGGYDNNRGGYNKNRGGYDKNVPDCGGEVDIYDKNRGGYNKNRGGYNKNRGGYNKNRGGYNKGWNGNDGYTVDCDQDQDFGGYNKNRGGSNKNSGGYKNRGGYINNRGDEAVDKYDTYVKDCDDDYSGYKKNGGGYKKNGGYNKNRGSYNKNGGGKNKNRGGYNKNRDGHAQHGYVSKFDDPYVEYQAGHHGGPGDMHFVPDAVNYHVGLGKRSAGESEVRGLDVRRAKIPEIGLLNAPSHIAEPKVPTSDVPVPKFEPPTPLAPELRKRPQIGDVNHPKFIPEPEDLPNKFLKPLQKPDWDAHPFKPKPQRPHVKQIIFEDDTSDSKETGIDKGAYWHKLEIPIFGFEHEAQIQPIHKLKHILFPKPPNSKKDETFTRMKLGPWSMRFGLDL